MGVVIFFWIRELLGLLCSSGFPRVYSSFYSSHPVPPFILAVAVIFSFAHSGCFVRLGRSTQLDMKGLVSIVRSIRHLFAGTRYWVLEYLLAASGPW